MTKSAIRISNFQRSDERYIKLYKASVIAQTILTKYYLVTVNCFNKLFLSELIQHFRVARDNTFLSKGTILNLQHQIFQNM